TRVQPMGARHVHVAPLSRRALPELGRHQPFTTNRLRAWTGFVPVASLPWGAQGGLARSSGRSEALRSPSGPGRNRQSRLGGADGAARAAATATIYELSPETLPALFTRALGIQRRDRQLPGELLIAECFDRLVVTGHRSAGSLVVRCQLDLLPQEISG